MLPTRDQFLPYTVSPEHVLYHDGLTRNSEFPVARKSGGNGPEYWLHHMTHDEAVVAAFQLQHDAGLMMTNLQILSQFVTSLNRMSSEVLRLAFGREQFPAEAMQAVLPSSRVRRAAHYMADMGLWRPTDSPGVPGPLPESSCNDSTMCMNCFPKLGP